VGNMIEVIIDSKGRISLPAEIRKELGIKPGDKIRVFLDGKKIIFIPSVTPEEFIDKMEGKLKFKEKLAVEDIKNVWKM
jgi:AbrB family looped-hinge helix DNA binding protein